MRNAFSSAGVLGLSAVQDVLDVAVSRMIPGAQHVPAGSIGADLKYMIRPRANISEVRTLSGTPAGGKQVDKLYGNVAGLPTMDNKFANTVMFLNRIQEFTMRRAVFLSTLDKNVRVTTGRSLDEVMRTQQFHLIPKEAFAKATDRALEVTFSKNPTSKIGKGFVSFFDAPGMSLVVTFPRYFTNAARYLWELTPGPLFTKLPFSKAEQAKMMSGDPSVLTKPMIGAGLVYTAYQVVKNQPETNKWNEVDVPGVGTMDVRTYPPFAAAMFVSDVIRRTHEGRLFDFDLTEAANAIIGLQDRSGVALEAVDKFVEAAAGVRDWEAAQRTLSQLGGEYTRRFTTPLAAIKDLAAGGAGVSADVARMFGALEPLAAELEEFAAEESKLRDTRTRLPWLDPALANIPGLNQSLPEAQDPARGATPTRTNPIARQLGVTLPEQKTEIRGELDRLQFRPQEVSPRSGNAEYDYAFNEKLGPVLQAAGGALVQAPEYKSLSPSTQSALLQEFLGMVRESVRGQLLAERPDMAVTRRIEAVPNRQRMLIEEKYGAPIGRLLERILATAGLQGTVRN